MCHNYYVLKFYHLYAWILKTSKRTPTIPRQAEMVLIYWISIEKSGCLGKVVLK
jgi:hypothetical protein